MAYKRSGTGAQRLAEARERLVAQVVSDMRERGAEWSRDWVCATPTNPATGNAYTGRNKLLLGFYMRELGLKDPRFCTYVQAQDKGWQVRRGAKSFPVEKWGEVFYDSRDPKLRIPQPKTREDKRALLRDPNIRTKQVPFGCYSVFAARDVEGLGPWEGLRPGLEESRLADFLEKNSPVPVEEALGDVACYVPSQDRIVMPERGQFRDDGGFARVLLHEQGHSTGHATRLGRDLSGRALSSDPKSRAAYAREELTAELNSLFCANELGVAMPEVGRDDEFSKSEYWENHVAYLKGWAEGLDDPADELMRAATAASKATDWLMRRCFAPALEAEREREAPVVALGIEAGREKGGEEKGGLEGRTPGDVAEAPEVGAGAGGAVGRAQEGMPVAPETGAGGPEGRDTGMGGEDRGDLEGKGAVEAPTGPRKVAGRACDMFSYEVGVDGSCTRTGAVAETLDRALSVAANDGGTVTWYVGDDAVAMVLEHADGSLELSSDIDMFAGNALTETVDEIAQGKCQPSYMAPWVADQVREAKEARAHEGTSVEEATRGTASERRDQEAMRAAEGPAQDSPKVPRG